MIVEAIRDDVFTGSYELEFGKRSQYQCQTCGKMYELVVHAAEGEFHDACDPIPSHFDLLSDAIDDSHKTEHHALLFQSDGVRVWNPLKNK